MRKTAIIDRKQGLTRVKKQSSIKKKDSQEIQKIKKAEITFEPKLTKSEKLKLCYYNKSKQKEFPFFPDIPNVNSNQATTYSEI